MLSQFLSFPYHVTSWINLAENIRNPTLKAEINRMVLNENRLGDFSHQKSTPVFIFKGRVYESTTSLPVYYNEETLIYSIMNSLKGKLWKEGFSFTIFCRNLSKMKSNIFIKDEVESNVEIWSPYSNLLQDFLGNPRWFREMYIQC